MGNSISNFQTQKNSKARSDAIDQQLQEESKGLKGVYKVLVLGSGESGKSTIMRQMRILYGPRYTVEELASYRAIIHKNVVDSAQSLAGAMKSLGVECVIPENQGHLDDILNFHLDPTLTYALTKGMPQKIHDLWRDPIIPRLIDDDSSEFYFVDSASYFFTEILRIGAPKYVPTETDILRAHCKNTGVTETKLKMGLMLCVKPRSKNIIGLKAEACSRIHMFDIESQRSKWKKWIHYCGSVTSIIFCTALSDYDQVFDDGSRNRMMESLILFESIVNSQWFSRTSIILFLNKIDLFRAKLPRVPLNKLFPKYTGDDNVNKATKHILWKFMEANHTQLSIYSHITQATDITGIRLVFVAVKETILQNALKCSGIL